MGSSDVIAGGASVRVGADVNPLLKGFSAAENRLKSFGNAVKAFGAAFVFDKVIRSVHNLATTFADNGGAIDDISQRTGDTAENISAVGYAAQMCGSSIEDLEGAFGKMSSVIAGAIAGDKSAVKLLSEIGLTAADLKGKLPTEQLAIFSDALSTITDSDTKTDMVKAIFGKSGTQLIPLLNEGSAGIAKLTQEAERLGLVMSTKDAQAAAALGDAFDNLSGASKGIVNTIGGVLAPALTGIVTYLSDATAAVSKFIAENKSLVIGVAAGTVALVAAGVAIGVLGVASYVAGAAITVVSGIVGGVYSAACATATLATSLLSASVALLGAAFSIATAPLTLAVGAIVAVGAAAVHAMGGFDAFGQAMRSSLNGILGLFKGLVSTANETFGGIATAISAGNIQGAIDILWAGIRVAWQQGADAINATWNAALIYIEGALDQTVGLLGKIWAGFQTAWTLGITGIEGAFDTAVTNIRGAWATGLAYLSAGIEKFAIFATKTLAEVSFKARELKVAISPIFGKAAAYENINNDRKKLAADLEAQSKKNANARQAGIDSAFDSKGLEARRQARNDRIAASGDTRAADAALADRSGLRQQRLEGIGKPSAELAKLQGELSALVAKAGESVKPAEDQIKKGQEATGKGSQLATSVAAPGLATRGSADAASSIIRSINSQRNPNSGVESRLDKSIAILNDIAKKTGFTVEEITL